MERINYVKRSNNAVKGMYLVAKKTDATIGAVHMSDIAELTSLREIGRRDATQHLGELCDQFVYTDDLRMIGKADPRGRRFTNHVVLPYGITRPAILHMLTHDVSGVLTQEDRRIISDFLETGYSRTSWLTMNQDAGLIGRILTSAVINALTLSFRGVGWQWFLVDLTKDSQPERKCCQTDSRLNNVADLVWASIALSFWLPATVGKRSAVAMDSYLSSVDLDPSVYHENLVAHFSNVLMSELYSHVNGYKCRDVDVRPYRYTNLWVVDSFLAIKGAMERAYAQQNSRTRRSGMRMAETLAVLRSIVTPFI